MTFAAADLLLRSWNDDVLMTAARPAPP